MLRAWKSEPPDSNRLRGGFGGRRRGIQAGEPVLQKIHSLHSVGDVLSHRPDRIKVLRFDREYAVDGNQTMRRFQPNDAAPGGGHANRAGCVGPERHVSHANRHDYRRTTTRTSRE